MGRYSARSSRRMEVMLRCPTICAELGCHQPTQRGSRWCDKHQDANSFLESRRNFDNDRRTNDPIYKMYSREPWPRFRAIMLAQNPICQRIQNGAQCRNPAVLVHHLISPRARRDLFVDPVNVTCLCSHCHPPDEGTPHWRPGADFAPTQFSLPKFC